MPLPKVVHVALGTVVVAFKLTLVWFLHTKMLLPALILGALWNVITIESTSCKQIPFPVVVKYMVTLPAVVSAVLGI